MEAMIKRTSVITGSPQTLEAVAKILPPERGTLARIDDQRYELNHPSFSENDYSSAEADVQTLLERMIALLHLSQPGGTQMSKMLSAVDTGRGGPTKVYKRTHLTIRRVPHSIFRPPTLAAE